MLEAAAAGLGPRGVAIASRVPGSMVLEAFRYFPEERERLEKILEIRNQTNQVIIGQPPAQKEENCDFAGERQSTRCTRKNTQADVGDDRGLQRRKDTTLATLMRSSSKRALGTSLRTSRTIMAATLQVVVQAKEVLSGAAAPQIEAVDSGANSGTEEGVPADDAPRREEQAAFLDVSEDGEEVRAELSKTSQRSARRRRRRGAAARRRWPRAPGRWPG